jgi:hypothetical protein
MPPKVQKEIVYPINSEEHFHQIVNPENKKLVGTYNHSFNHLCLINSSFLVIDLHLTWCGPCSVMTTNYRSLFFTFEEADKRLEFWNVNRNSLEINQ